MCCREGVERISRSRLRSSCWRVMADTLYDVRSHVKTFFMLFRAASPRVWCSQLVDHGYVEVIELPEQGASPKDVAGRPSALPPNEHAVTADPPPGERRSEEFWTVLPWASEASHLEDRGLLAVDAMARCFAAGAPATEGAAREDEIHRRQRRRAARRRSISRLLDCPI